MMSLKRVLLGAVLTAAAIVLIGCPDGSLLDLFGGAPGPTPGNGGAISVDAIGATTMSISWTAATDDTTAAADIEYQVYYATSDSIDTPENAAANGSAVFADWTAAAVTATLSGLTRDTQYWVIVVARDADANPNLAAYTPTSVRTAADANEPTPGNGGVISVDAIDATTMSISWTAATDDITAEGDIEYQVYYSTADNIDTPEDAAANGSEVFADWTPASESATLPGLTRDTWYWANVVARDAAANAAAYATTSALTPVGPLILLEINEATPIPIAEDDVVDYGDVFGFLTKQFNIWNAGDQVLTLSPTPALRVVLEGDTGIGAFYVSTQPLEAISPSTKETFSITFQSDMSGSKLATVTIDSNDPANPAFIFQVTAYGVC